MTVSVTPPYARRQAPSSPGDLKGFLDQETQNIQRAIDASYPGAIIVRKTGNDDDTKRIQGAIKANRTTFLTDGDFVISDDLLGASNHQLVLSGPATTITQITPGKGVYKRVGLDNSWFHYNGGTIYGPGVWSAAWVGIDGHDERGEKVYGCTNSGSTLAKIKNFGLAGMVVLGGSKLRFLNPEVEGTNVLGSPLSFLSDYQFGYLMGHDLTYGAFSDVQFWGISAYNTNFGFNSYQNVPGSTGLLLLAGAHFYQIIGQHGGYCGTSNTQLPSYVAHDCGLDGLKMFSGVIAEILTGIDCSNFNIYNCPNGQAVEMGVSGAGYLYKCHASGKAENCARALTVDGDVRNCTAKIQSKSMTQRALYVAQGSGTGPSGNVWDIESDGTVEHSVLIAASTSKENTLRAKLEHPSTGGGGYSGMDLNACTSLTIENPQVLDDAGLMLNGIFAEVGALGVKVTGTATIKGYTANAMRGPIALHATVDADANTSAYFDTGADILPVVPMVIQGQSVSAANIALWKMNLADLSACTVEVQLVGKKSGSVDQGTFTSIVMAMRNGGGAVIPAVAGNPTTVSTIVSAGFLGAFSWGVTGNAVRLLVNSGAAATVVDWTATIKQTRQT